jgi:hypothetical protein
MLPLIVEAFHERPRGGDMPSLFRSYVDQKDAFSDTAVVVKEEALKQTPDEGKLKRWGGRLIDLSKDIGMKVAAAEIVHLLGKMFGA